MILRIGCALLFCALFRPLAVEAWISQDRSLYSTTRDADAIVVGRIIDLRSTLIHGHVWTDVTVSVEKQIKGPARNSYVFRMPGGEQTVKGRTLVTRVEGAPEFQVMQKGVFFLSGRAPEYFRLADWEKGYHRVETQNGFEMTIKDSSWTLLETFLNEVYGILKDDTGKRQE